MSCICADVILELEAKKEGTSVAEVTRKAIKKYIKGKPKQENGAGAEVLLKWAKKAKKYKSHYKDKNLSTTYKEYLYGSKSKKFGRYWKNTENQ